MRRGPTVDEYLAGYYEADDKQYTGDGLNESEFRSDAGRRVLCTRQVSLQGTTLTLRHSQFKSSLKALNFDREVDLMIRHGL